MKRFMERVDRHQAMLLPDCLDDHVDEESPVRAFDAFVDMHNLAVLGSNVVPEPTGRQCQLLAQSRHANPILE